MPPFVQKAMAGPEEQDNASRFTPKTLELLAGTPAHVDRLERMSRADWSAMCRAEQQGCAGLLLAQLGGIQSQTQLCTA